MLDRAPPETKDQLSATTRPVAFRGAGFTPGGSRSAGWIALAGVESAGSDADIGDIGGRPRRP